MAVGVNVEGKRSVLGVSAVLSEAEVHWRAFLGDLRERGLFGMRMITSDHHSGLRAALRATCLPRPWSMPRASVGGIVLAPYSVHSTIRVDFRNRILARTPDSGATFLVAMLHTHLCALALLLIPFLTTSCSDPGSATKVSHPGMSASSGDAAASGGGFRKEAGEPTLFYGTVVGQGTRRYTYLVVGPRLVVGRDYRSANAGSTSIDGRDLHGSHRGDRRCQPLGPFPGQTRAGDKRAPGIRARHPQRVMPPDDGWFYLFDWRDPESTPRPIAIEMPELPSDLDDLAGFTEEFVSQLVRTNEAVGVFVSD